MKRPPIGEVIPKIRNAARDGEAAKTAVKPNTARVEAALANREKAVTDRAMQLSEAASSGRG